MLESQFTSSSKLIVRYLGLIEYEPVWRAMQNFTDHRDASSNDEIWLLEHPPIFTQGQAGKAEHILGAGDIPILQVDRGGQVTYHGPGQLVAYLMLDLKRLKLGVRDLVSIIERTIVKVLGHYQINATPRADAPGVYINEAGITGAKIAQLGLRVRRGCTFHGLSLNVDMNMEPFLRINPCGHEGLKVTSISQQIRSVPSQDKISKLLVKFLQEEIVYREVELIKDGLLPSR